MGITDCRENVKEKLFRLWTVRSEQESDGSDGWVPILVRVDPFERSVGERALDEHGVVWVNHRFVVHSLLSLP